MNNNTTTTTQHFIAPLQIRKASGDGRASEQASPVDVTRTQQAARVYDAATFEENYSPRPRFQNFLRAVYPFHSTATPTPSTVTLDLNAGDIILVHSIHTNGWADGTQLETGARGWLPTNYCEAYDYATMRPLLKALMEFWDIIRSGTDSDVASFHNLDYMRGMVAGVRYLLEKSECLTRESALVRQHDSIRKVRKMLLSALSNLVKAHKQFQQIVSADTKPAELEELLDDMLLKAFHVVIRAVCFYDVWSELSPTNVTFPTLELSETIRSAAMLSRRVTNTTASSDATARDQSLQVFPDDINPSTLNRPASVSSRRRTLTHRMSYTGRKPLAQKSNLASEQLNHTYDAFLGVLASFLGSHMQSRSSAELLLTTQQAVKAWRRLLNVVEFILEHSAGDADGLMEAKDDMYDKITDLVLAAKQVFRPLHSADDEMIYLPSEGMQLVTAATACVSGAGRCVAKARMILEDVGDFELDEVADSPEPSPAPTQLEHVVPQSFDLDSPVDSPPRPRLEISTTIEPVASIRSAAEFVTPNTDAFWTPVAGPLHESPQSATSSASQPQSATSLHPRTTFNRPFVREVVHNTGSQTTLVSSTRDSGPSFVSTSTRATSPDQSHRLSPTPAEAADEHSDGEDEIMEHAFAHELLFNAEGKVTGGSLNAIIERMTAHDSTPDAIFTSTVYLTFRLFTTPKDFAEALVYRFHYVAKTPKISAPVRLRVYNVFKGWLESHWRHDCDEGVLPFVSVFARDTVMPVLGMAGKRLLELVEIVGQTHQSPVPRMASAVGKTSISSTESLTPLSAPILTRSQLSALRSWRNGGQSISIMDFDPMELARQITIKESNLFCSIMPEELLATEFTKQSSSLAVNVRAMAQLSTDLANLVADSILQYEEVKKRAQVIKQWVKIANKCLELNNYDTLMAIICALNSSIISRLRKTWDLVNQKTKNCFEGLKNVVDLSKNYSTLRQRLAGHVPPCLPFVGMYLTDLTFVDHGNPARRELKTGSEVIQVINLDKHMKTARIISDLQRFQIPYRLTEVSELQTWMQDELVRVRAAGEQHYQNHYQRSLLLEPREQRPQTMSNFASFASVSKDKFDFLAWTHIGKDKTAAVNS